MTCTISHTIVEFYKRTKLSKYLWMVMQLTHVAIQTCVMRSRQTHRRETWPTCAYTHVETRARRFTVKVSISTRNRSYGNAQAAPSLIPIRRATRVHRTSWTHPSSPLSWFLFSFFFPIFLFSFRYVCRIRCIFSSNFFVQKIVHALLEQRRVYALF